MCRIRTEIQLPHVSKIFSADLDGSTPVFKMFLLVLFVQGYNIVFCWFRNEQPEEFECVHDEQKYVKVQL